MAGARPDGVDSLVGGTPTGLGPQPWRASTASTQNNSFFATSLASITCRPSTTRVLLAPWHPWSAYLFVAIWESA